MNRQQLLDNFIKLRNGKGRACRKNHHDAFTCLYKTKDNSGCAIGCQPGFHEKFPEYLDSSYKIFTLIEKEKRNGQTKIIVFFQIKNTDDELFLQELQELHDCSNNWNYDLKIKQSVIQSFCDKYQLNIPA